MKWKVGIEGKDLLMYKFIGISESKDAKTKPDQQQAETYTYRNKQGELAIPIGNMRACIIDGFVQSAGNKLKTKTKMEVSPRIKVQSLDEDKMYLTLSNQNYEIDKQSVPSGGRMGGIRDWCIRPRIDEWSTEFILQENLDIGREELLYKLEFAGTDVGLLSNRPNGFGRFKVVNLEEQSTAEQSVAKHSKA